MEEPQLSEEQKLDIKQELGLSKEDFKSLKKKFNKLKGRDDRAFLEMLKVTSRNHYTLNQMVDRKARIMLSVNALILSLIIGKVISNPVMNGWNFYLLLTLGVTGFISIIYSMLAIKPEKTHGGLDEQSIRGKKGNPLFFGNFKNMTEEVYEDAMMEMVNDRDFIYRSMIQDIYHLGQILEKKRQYLRSSLNIFIAGLCIALILTFLKRILFTIF